MTTRSNLLKMKKFFADLALIAGTFAEQLSIDRKGSIMSDLIETIRNNFMAFGLKSFATINSNQKLDHDPYFNVLAFELDKVRLGVTRRLIISMPPRHGKTFFGSICLPAWILAHNPSMRIMIVTYGADLAEEIVPQIRTIMRSNWYRQVSRARLSKKQAVDLETTAGGRVFAVSIEGAVTGRGADVIITDDLLQQKDSENYVKLERVNELFENTIRTRLNNPKKGSIVVIAHRLNKDDLPGHLLNEGGWKHLKLALIAPRSRAYDIEDGKKWHRKKGELLRPGAFSRRDIQKLRASCKIFELLYQQNSKADERLRITPEHFPRFKGSPVTFANAPVVISIDPGQKHGPTASFSVIQVFSPWNERYCLRDQWRQQACWSDLLAACKNSFAATAQEPFSLKIQAWGLR